MSGNGTAKLREAAPVWSLAGDKQLLDILQNIHQSLMTKCQEVNHRLDEMVTSLDDASIDLQNVNNKFMALSNSQFVESRVYDDDVDVKPPEVVKETPKPVDSESELAKLKASVQVLQDMHETIHIIDSESDTESDDEDITRIVMKPKDLYSDRPLPYVIGTVPWRRKWHAGLIAEDSDSDSTNSKPDVQEEQYSDSDVDDGINDVKHKLTVPDRQESVTSSELPSEQDAAATVPVPVRPSPSAVAEELARKLRGSAPQVSHPPATENEYILPKPTTRKINRPEQPSPSTIFFDEPPPLDQCLNDSDADDDDDDIFAELHKSKPVYGSKSHSSVVEDLFSGLGGAGNDNFMDKPPQPAAAKSRAGLFDDESESELFPSGSSGPLKAARNDVVTAKKPIGGISLFGSNKGTETIGEAILKRNRRKSSSDEDVGTDTDTPAMTQKTNNTSKLYKSSNTETLHPKPSKKNVESTVSNTQRDIFDDLFAKSDKQNKKVIENKEQIKKKEVKAENKVDLFSDNLFDDIDDIFRTDVIAKVDTNVNKKQESIFDDDDLFADIPEAKSSKPQVKERESKKKDIFDSDDDIFSDKISKKVSQNENNTKNLYTSQSHATSSIFDDDDSNGSGIFSKFTEPKVNMNTKNNDIVKEINTINVSKSDKINVPIVSQTINNNNSGIARNKNTSRKKPSLFDDEDDDDLFNSSKKEVSLKSSNIVTKTNAHSVQSNINKSNKNKISLFDDESESESDSNADLFPKPIPKQDNGKKLSKIILPNETPLQNEISCADDKIENTTLSSDMSSIKNKSSIFDDYYDDEDLFGKRNDTLSHGVHKGSPVNPKNDEIKESIEDIPTTIDKIIGGKIQDSLPSSAKHVKGEIRTEEPLDNVSQNRLIYKIIPDTEVNKIVPMNDKVNPKSPKPRFKNSNITETNSIVDTKTQVSNLKDTLLFSPSSEIFESVSDEPPAFEKSTESKKSKNVNALFDDDSDDETLFFKKNDATLDETPSFIDDSANEALFDIFHNEPPALDVSFVEKLNTISNNVFGNSLDDELFNSPTETTPSNLDVDFVNNKSINNEESLLTTTKEIDISNKSSSTASALNIEIDKSMINDDSLEKDLFRNIKTESDEKAYVMPKTKLQSNELNERKVSKTLATEADHSVVHSAIDTPDSPTNEPKKIGRLKSMNFNIDVSSLLPGASPKKKTLEQTDGQKLSSQSYEDLHSKEDIEPVIIKSISFEGEPKSQVLDNKLSKQRAKIQVKRRPSTRRARQEAVRKTAGNFDEDSTDNSSSIDDIPKTELKKPNASSLSSTNDENETQNLGSESTNLETDVNKNNAIESYVSNIANETESYRNVVIENKDSVPISNIKNGNKLESNMKVNNSSSKNPTVATNIETSNKNILEKDDFLFRRDNSRNVTSKVVYILNDEDIFNTSVEKPITEPLANIKDELDSGPCDLLKSSEKSSKTHFDNNVNNLEKTYSKETSNIQGGKSKETVSDLKSKPKMSLFDDLSDDENLFNTSKTIVKPKSILDSDSEDELFGGKKERHGDSKSKAHVKTVKAKTEDITEVKKAKIIVKASLFGDDDDYDNDDLFGSKIKREPETAPQTSRHTREVLSKPAEPVFDDPLSMLGEEED